MSVICQRHRLEDDVSNQTMSETFYNVDKESESSSEFIVIFFNNVTIITGMDC